MKGVGQILSGSLTLVEVPKQYLCNKPTAICFVITIFAVSRLLELSSNLCATSAYSVDAEVAQRVEVISASFRQIDLYEARYLGRDLRGLTMILTELPCPPVNTG